MTASVTDKFAGRTRWGYVIAFILLLISYLISFISTQNSVKQSGWVSHSNEVIHQLDNILRFVTETESAARGFVITGNAAFLDQFKNGRHNTDSVWLSARALTADNPSQQHKIDSLKGLINARFVILEQGISAYQQQHSVSSVLSMQHPAMLKMQAVEGCVRYIQNIETQLLQNRRKEATRYTTLTKAFTVISLLLAILLTLYSMFIFNRENQEKLEASGRADSYREELERRVKELGNLNLELIELRNMEKFAATGRIARTIAHEVRNPLTNINLAAEQLRNELPDDRDLDAFFEIIQRNSNRINQLIGNLLNATRINELRYEHVSINTVVENSLEYARDRLELKKIKVVKDLDKEICPVYIDREKLEIALLNIIVNAVEAMEDHGTLTVSTQARGERCVVQISDTGKGMSREEINSLFEPFFTTKEKGNGLGLTNTQNIILAHSGNITVESEISKGTTFHITLKIASPPSVAQAN